MCAEWCVCARRSFCRNSLRIKMNDTRASKLEGNYWNRCGWRERKGRKWKQIKGKEKEWERKGKESKGKQRKWNEREGRKSQVNQRKTKPNKGKQRKGNGRSLFHRQIWTVKPLYKLFKAFLLLTDLNCQAII